MPRARDIQRSYYERTAGEYDALHAADGVAHEEAFAQMATHAVALGIRSILDVGAGTGRTILWFRDRHPEIDVIGVEPVGGLIDQAIEKGVPRHRLIRAAGERLPFSDDAFDAVCAVATMHHVSEPSPIVDEMMRVARKAIFISDNNRFGHGSTFGRVIKLVLWKSGLWKSAYWMRTRGRGYRISPGDGLFYSYSVYDSLHQLEIWADRILVIPTEPPTRSGLLHPLLTTFHLLICAIRTESLSKT